MNEHSGSMPENGFPFPFVHACASSVFLQTLLVNSPIAIVALDRDHRYGTANPAFLQLFGYSDEELLATEFDECIATPDTRVEAKRLTSLVLQGQKAHAITRRCRRDGAVINVEVFGIPLVEDGRLAGVYGLYKDLTETYQTRSALQTVSDRLAALEQSLEVSSPLDVPQIELTRRESDVLTLLAQGNTNKAVASRLGISVRTVEFHRTNLNQKCGFRSVADLVHFSIAQRRHKDHL